MRRYTRHGDPRSATAASDSASARAIPPLMQCRLSSENDIDLIDAIARITPAAPAPDADSTRRRAGARDYRATLFSFTSKTARGRRHPRNMRAPLKACPIVHNSQRCQFAAVAAPFTSRDAHRSERSSHQGTMPAHHPPLPDVVFLASRKSCRLKALRCLLTQVTRRPGGHGNLHRSPRSRRYGTPMRTEYMY